MNERWHGIDFWRGIAVILMVVFHFGYDLDFFHVISIHVDQGIWLLMARFVQITFMLTTGMTLFLSYERDRNSLDIQSLFAKRLRHAFKLFAFGMLITVITFFIFGDGAVKFGVLHFYGVASILALPLLRFGIWNALFGGGVVLMGLADWTAFENPWLFPLAATSSNFQSLDYFPIFPWFGFFLLGVVLADFLKRFPTGNFKCRSVQFMGQYSLWIYLIHQPILIGLIYFCSKIFLYSSL